MRSQGGGPQGGPALQVGEMKLEGGACPLPGPPGTRGPVDLHRRLAAGLGLKPSWRTADWWNPPPLAAPRPEARGVT